MKRFEEPNNNMSEKEFFNSLKNTECNNEKEKDKKRKLLETANGSLESSNREQQEIMNATYTE